MASSARVVYLGRMRFLLSVGVLLVLSTVTTLAAAETIQVGPTRAKKKLQDIQTTVKPGDVVELDGDATYPGGVFFKEDQGGTAEKKITIKGIKVNGKRPLITGGGSGVLEGIGMV